MKCRIFIIVVLVVVAWIAGRQLGIGSHGEGRFELNQSYQLTPGGRVEVSGINGPVEIATAGSETAEVHIQITARDEDALQNHQISVQQSASSLTIRGENRNGWRFWRWLNGPDNARQSVTLKLPRRVELSTRGVNGRVSVGELDGAVHVSGVNGKVEIARATGAAEVGVVHGMVSLGFALPGIDGLHVHG